MNTCIPFSEYNPYYHKIESRHSSLEDCEGSIGPLPPECCTDPGCQCLDGYIIIKEPSKSVFYNSCVNPRDFCLSGDFWDWYAESTEDSAWTGDSLGRAAELKNNPPFDCLGYIYNEITDASCYSDGACSKKCPAPTVPPCWPNCPDDDSGSSSSSSSALCENVCVAIGEVQNLLTCECNCVCPDGVPNLGVVFDPNNPSQLICSCLVSSSSTSCPFVECGGESIVSDCGLYGETCYMDCDLCECVCGSSSSVESSSSSNPNYNYVCVRLKSSSSSVSSDSSSSSSNPNYVCVELKSSSSSVSSDSSSSSISSIGLLVLSPNSADRVGIYDISGGVLIQGPEHGQPYPAFTEAMRLSNGKVLFVPLKSSHIGLYDLSQNEYVNGPAHGIDTSLNGAFFHGVEMDNDKVLLIPYTGQNAFGIYDISANTLTMGPSANSPGVYLFGRGTKLANGKVVVPPMYGAYIRVYDPANNTVAMGPMVQGSKFSDSALLPDGKVLLVPFSGEIGIYDPETNTYQAGPQMSGLQSNERGFGASVTMQDGRVFFAPYGSPTIGMYDTNTNTYSNGPFIPDPQENIDFSPSHRECVLLSDGMVALIPYGGSTLWVYDPVSNTVFSPSSVPLVGYSGAVLADNVPGSSSSI